MKKSLPMGSPGLLPDHIIFDLDGTLIDSYPDIAACLKLAFRSAGIDLPSRLDRALIGPPLTDLVALLAPQASPEAQTRVIQLFRNAYDSRDYPLTRPMPGSNDLLRELWSAGAATYIATNKLHRPSRRILERLSWTGFRDLIARDTQPGRTLDKLEILLTLGKKWKMTTACTWLIGDSASDIEAARACGFRSAAYGTGYGDRKLLKASQPDVWLDDLRDFLPAIRPQSANELLIT